MKSNMNNGRSENNRFTCYFCNKTIENETEMGHNAMCGSVLEPCPNKCGSYIPRMTLKKHNMECVNRTTSTMPRVPRMDDNMKKSQNMAHITHNSNSLGKNSGANNNHRLQEEIYKLSRKVADLEGINTHSQTKSQIEATNSSQFLENLEKRLMHQGSDIEKLKHQSKLSFDWKNHTEVALSNIKHSVASIQNEISNTNSMMIGIQNKTLSLDKMQEQINYLRDNVLKEQTYNRQVYMNMEDNFEHLKTHLAQENAITISILNELRDASENMKKDLEIDKTTIGDHNTKFTNVIFDLRAASQIASEAIEKVEIIERDFAKIQKEINQMKLDMEILEGLSSSNEINSVPGRLLWKITEVENKIMKAREFGSILKSPVFSTHEYGYRIRILLYFNGLKKWKDRYALMCIHVLKGEYDMLLRWPCHIEATITIRNLENSDKVKPLSKYVSAKRQTGGEEEDEPQESSSSYIFVPHSVLLKPNYVQNDTLFIDVNIHKNGKLETSL
ncbi:unnamed protein product [Phaedon cochleariae]|uniref:MATH domain-containing protein n=1 Tax=Phaedon cochleariae TaxID=80249 RepID=A0A9P0DJV5_PHACE|nr:unnamed protein product [Phaedon cochleariae]